LNPVTLSTGRLASGPDGSSRAPGAEARRSSDGVDVNGSSSIESRVAAILTSLDQAAFVWDIASDAMVWTDHNVSVFRDIPASALASGAAFANLIEPVRSIRTDTLMTATAADEGSGVPYRIEYGIRATTSAEIV